MHQVVRRERDGTDVSLTWVQIDGEHRALRTDASTRIYYILDGNFIFDIAGLGSKSAITGDTLIIYKSTIYGFVGKGKYLVINAPAFQDGDDKYSDELRNER